MPVGLPRRFGFTVPAREGALFAKVQVNDSPSWTHSKVRPLANPNRGRGGPKPWEGLEREALAAAPGFAKLRVGLPLLDGSCTENYLALSAILEKLYPAREGEAVVLMGHGAKGKHKANAAYTSLQVMLELARVRNIWIGTVEGWPTFEEIHSRLGGCRGLRRIRLAPLMLCAGDHALHDMAGDGPDSWKSILAADGYEVECVMQGLGSQPQVQALYAYHLNNQLEGRL